MVQEEEEEVEKHEEEEEESTEEGDRRGASSQLARGKAVRGEEGSSCPRLSDCGSSEQRRRRFDLRKEVSSPPAAEGRAW